MYNLLVIADVQSLSADPPTSVDKKVMRAVLLYGMLIFRLLHVSLHFKVSNSQPPWLRCLCSSSLPSVSPSPASNPASPLHAPACLPAHLLFDISKSGTFTFADLQHLDVLPRQPCFSCYAHNPHNRDISNISNTCVLQRLAHRLDLFVLAVQISLNPLCVGNGSQQLRFQAAFLHVETMGDLLLSVKACFHPQLDLHHSSTETYSLNDRLPPASALLSGIEPGPAAPPGPAASHALPPPQHRCKQAHKDRTGCFLDREELLRILSALSKSLKFRRCLRCSAMRCEISKGGMLES
eukprot:752405-Hanusia_phi.AAC.1